jgi:hypothetical protein
MMTADSTAHIIQELREILHSPVYADRLEAIHRHYHNSKSEGRYRDALLEQFNSGGLARGHDLRAYAEADKVDMVVTRPGTSKTEWIRVELKYQFVYDLAHRVKATLGNLDLGRSDESVLDDLNALPKNIDLTRIVFDCLEPAPGDPEYRCNLFVLIVQDRNGAMHQEAQRSMAERKEGRAWRCPELKERDVRLQFLHEQISLDALHQGEAYDKAWIEPAWDLLKLIHRFRRFNLQVAARKIADGAGPFPLTSYLFTLDFTAPADLPPDAADLISTARKAVTA